MSTTRWFRAFQRFGQQSAILCALRQGERHFTVFLCAANMDGDIV